MAKTEKPLAKAIDHCGGQSKLAEKIGKSQQLVSYYLNHKHGVVPAEWALAIESACEGAVTRHQLCPTVFGQEAAAYAENAERESAA